MAEFIDALIKYQFMQNAILASLLISVSCAITGSYVVVRRISYLAGSIAHSVLGGMGVARYLQVTQGMEYMTPLLGAIIAALLSAWIIGIVTIRAKQREDTAIGAIWAIGMAIGILFIYKTPGYNEDLMNYLFGNILMVSNHELIMIGVLDLIIIGVSIIFYRELIAISFDEEFARLRGINVNAYYLVLLSIISLTVVLLLTIVGIVMVIALITLPAAIAGRFTKSLWGMMILAVILNIIFTTTGIMLSFSPNLPSGPTIIMIAGVFYLLSNFIKKNRRSA